MPKTTRINGELEPRVSFEKVWFTVPLETGTTMIDEETHLVHPRLADYIELLENTIGKDNLPKLPKL